MKVLSKNVQLIFTCETDECKSNKEQDRYESDPIELSISGSPICPVCNEETIIDPDCFIKN